MSDFFKCLSNGFRAQALIFALAAMLAPIAGCQWFSSNSRSPSSMDAAVARQLDKSLHVGMQREQALSILGLDPSARNGAVAGPGGMESESFISPRFPGYWIVLDESVQGPHDIQIRSWKSYRNTSPYKPH